MNLYPIDPNKISEPTIFKQAAESNQIKVIIKCEYCDTSYSEEFKQHVCKNISKEYAKQSIKKEIDTVDHALVKIPINYDASNLKKHIHTVHEGHKHYKCKSCTKSFTRQGTLKKHIHIVHEGYENFKCESCSKSYSAARNLKNHIHTVHEGHKDYKCESCGKSFARAGKLKIHIETIHEGHKDKCESCGKSFS